MLTRQFEGRLTVVHHRSDHGQDERTEAAGAPGESPHEVLRPGPLDTDRLREHLRDPRLQSGQWFLCGPSAMLDDIEPALAQHGVASEDVHRELFTAPEDDEDPDLSNVVPATLTVTVGGQQSVVHSEGTASVLETVLDGGIDVPYLCTGGICGTCRATVIEGTVHMQQNYALSDDEVADGAVLTCQSRPTSDSVAIDYDH